MHAAAKHGSIHQQPLYMSRAANVTQPQTQKWNGRVTCRTSFTDCDITPFFVASFSMSCSHCCWLQAQSHWPGYPRLGRAFEHSSFSQCVEHLERKHISGLMKDRQGALSLFLQREPSFLALHHHWHAAGPLSGENAPKSAADGASVPLCCKGSQRVSSSFCRNVFCAEQEEEA